jgi:hypothetical protein
MEHGSNTDQMQESGFLSPDSQLSESVFHPWLQNRLASRIGDTVHGNE